jgi:predicted Zn-dependent protease with MMP-like domain
LRHPAGNNDASTFQFSSTIRIHYEQSNVFLKLALMGLRTLEIPEEYVQRVIDIVIQTNNRASQTAAEHIRLIETLRLSGDFNYP